MRTKSIYSELTPRISITKLIQKRSGDAYHILLSDLYFGHETITYGATLKRWTGTMWTKAKLRVNTGNFVSKTLKVFKAETWQNVDTL